MRRSAGCSRASERNSSYFAALGSFKRKLGRFVLEVYGAAASHSGGARGYTLLISRTVFVMHLPSMPMT